MENKLSITEIEKRYPEFFTSSLEELIEKKELASNAYYNLGTAIMSDEKFDSLEIAIKHRFPDNKAVLDVGSSVKGLLKMEHTYPGKTQFKAHSISELEETFTNLNATYIRNSQSSNEDIDIKNEKFIVSEKLDGVSLYVKYDKRGDLKSIVTRGDGVFGEDITINARNITGLKNKIDISLYDGLEIEEVEIRGEGIMTNEGFEQIKELYLKESGKVLKNPRNTAAGFIKRLDGKNIESINFMPYEEILTRNDGEIFQRDEIEQISTLSKLGFTTPKWEVIKGLDEMELFYKRYQESERSKLRTDKNGYEIDGLVFKINSAEIQKRLGLVNGRQNGQIALKFPPEMAISKLIDIYFSISDSGIITPVAQIEPIDVGGVTISNLSLANKDTMNALMLKKGDRVEVSRRGDVIPKIERNLKFEEFYIEFHKFVLESVFPTIEKIEKELGDSKEEVLFKKALNELYGNIELDINSDILNIELRINNIIRESIFKNDEFLIFTVNKDKDILKEVQKDFLKSYKKDLEKSLNSFEKGLSKNEIIKDLFHKFNDGVNSKRNEMLNSINNEAVSLREANIGNIEFIKNCPICGRGVSSDNSSVVCYSSECDNLKRGKIGIFITKNKHLIVAGELEKIDKFFTQYKKEEITRELFNEYYDNNISLFAVSIWEKFENGTITFDKLKDELFEDAKKSGIGKSKINEVYEKGIATTIKDLFKIKIEDFKIGVDNKGKDVYLEGWGEKSISNFIKDISKLSKLTGVEFLTGMNIRSASSSRLEKILEVFDFNDLVQGRVKREDILKLKGFGEIIVDDMIKDLEDKREEILELLEVIEIKKGQERTILKDEEKIKFVITGSVEPKDTSNPSKEWNDLKEAMVSAGFSKSKKIDGVYVDTIDRSGLTAYLKYLGHEVLSKVTGTTNYLINLDINSKSSKNNEAKELGVEIILPEEVLKVIEKNQELKKNNSILAIGIGR